MERADVARHQGTGSMPMAPVAEEWLRYCSNKLTFCGGPDRCSSHWCTWCCGGAGRCGGQLPGLVLCLIAVA